MKLGLDFGNGNGKAVLVKDKKVVKFFYQPNLGVKTTLAKLMDLFLRNGYDVSVDGTGITGAGRHYINNFLNGTVRTEILCQYRGIKELYPRVSSIIEMGKEDSKGIFIEDGIISEAVFNGVCSGGLGNYIDTICNRFNLTLERFDDLAISSNNALNIPTKCAVFGLSTCLNYLQRGEDVKDIVAGVARAVARNFLSMLKSHQLETPCVFSGGVALLKSVRRAFQNELGFKLQIPENPLFTGAYGAALYAGNSKKTYLNEIRQKIGE